MKFRSAPKSELGLMMVSREWPFVKNLVEPTVTASSSVWLTCGRGPHAAAHLPSAIDLSGASIPSRIHKPCRTAGISGSGGPRYRSVATKSGGSTPCLEGVSKSSWQHRPVADPPGVEPPVKEWLRPAVEQLPQGRHQQLRLLGLRQESVHRSQFVLGEGPKG